MYSYPMGDATAAAGPAARARARRRPIGLAGLRGFEAAARHRSFTLAAQELSLTQSSVSRQIAALEQQVGAVLFVRRTRALELTDAGERLQRMVQQALTAIDRTVDEIRGSGGPPRVTVATYASFASLWLVPRLAAFQQAHPGIDVRIDASDRLVDMEAEGIDIALRWLPPDRTVPTTAQMLLEEEVAPAVSPRLLAAAKDRALALRTPADLNRLPILAMDDTVPSSPYSSWTRWCEFAGMAPVEGAARLYFTYVDQSVQAAVRGQGVALVRTPFLDDLVAGGDLVLPFPALRMRTGYRYFLIVNAQRAALPHVAAFRDWVIAEFARGPHRLT